MHLSWTMVSLFLWPMCELHGGEKNLTMCYNPLPVRRTYENMYEKSSRVVQVKGKAKKGLVNLRAVNSKYIVLVYTTIKKPHWNLTKFPLSLSL